MCDCKYDNNDEIDFETLTVYMFLLKFNYMINESTDVTLVKFLLLSTILFP